MGFGLYGSSNGSAKYVAQIELKQSYGGVLASNSCKYYSDGSSNTFRVFFDTPVQVEPDRAYTASVTLDGAELSYFGQEGMSEAVSGCVTFQFQCAVESTNGTGVQGGQIPELLFYGPNPGDSTAASGASATSAAAPPLPAPSSQQRLHLQSPAPPSSANRSGEHAHPTAQRSPSNPNSQQLDGNDAQQQQQDPHGQTSVTCQKTTSGP